MKFLHVLAGENGLLRVASLSVALTAIVNARPSAQTDTLDAVLARAGAYVLEFQRRMCCS